MKYMYKINLSKYYHITYILLCSLQNKTCFTKAWEESFEIIQRKNEMLVSSHYSSLLTHYQTTNFRLFQNERVCRQQFQI